MEIIKKLSEMWKNAPAKTKAKFGKMYETDKLRYDREMATYVPPPQDYEDDRKKRIKLDPNRPKGPISAYIHFGNEKRSALRAANPGEKITSIMKRIGAEWKQIGKKEKKKYNKMAKKDRKRYAREMAAYEPPPPPSQSAKETLKQMQAASAPTAPERSATRKPAVEKDPNRPKRPPSAYLLFLGATRPGFKATHPELNPKDMMTRMAALWRQSSASDRKPFEVQATARKAEYDKLMASYTPPAYDPEPGEVTSTSVSALTAAGAAGTGAAGAEAEAAAHAGKKKRPKRDPHAPKRAGTAYLLYCNAHRPAVTAANKDKKGTEIVTLLAGGWNKLSDGAKKKWQAKADLAKKEYAVKLELYKKSQHYRDWNAGTGGGGGGGGGGAPAGSSKPHKYAKKKKTVYAKTALQFYSEAKYKKVALKNADADDAMIHTILRKKFDSLSDQRRIKYTELAREYAARGGSDV